MKLYSEHQIVKLHERVHGVPGSEKGQGKTTILGLLRLIFSAGTDHRPLCDLHSGMKANDLDLLRYMLESLQEECTIRLHRLSSFVEESVRDLNRSLASTHGTSLLLSSEIREHVEYLQQLAYKFLPWPTENVEVEECLTCTLRRGTSIKSLFHIRTSILGRRCRQSPEHPRDEPLLCIVETWLHLSLDRELSVSSLRERHGIEAVTRAIWEESQDLGRQICSMRRALQLQRRSQRTACPAEDLGLVSPESRRDEGINLHRGDANCPPSENSEDGWTTCESEDSADPEGAIIEQYRHPSPTSSSLSDDLSRPRSKLDHIRADRKSQLPSLSSSVPPEHRTSCDEQGTELPGDPDQYKRRKIYSHSIYGSNLAGSEQALGSENPAVGQRHVQEKEKHGTRESRGYSVGNGKDVGAEERSKAYAALVGEISL
jgi:hypothetical protein